MIRSLALFTAGISVACSSGSVPAGLDTDASSADSGGMGHFNHPVDGGAPDVGKGDTGSHEGGQSGDGGGCVLEGGCGIVTLEKGGGPSYVAVDDTNVYWTSTGSCTVTDGGATVSTGLVMKVPKAGGTPVTLASGQLEPQAIATDGMNVYWVNNVGAGCAASGGAVLRLAPDGGTVTTVAASQTSAKFVALDSTSVYWTTSDDIMSAPLLAMGDPTPTTLASGQGASAGLALSGESVYWAQASGAGKVLGVPVAGGAVVTLTTAGSGCVGFTADGTNVYWAYNPGEYLNFNVMSVPIAGGKPSTLDTNQYIPSNMASDGKSLYWTNYGTTPGADDDSVMKASLSGSSPITIASAQANPLGIAVDGTRVYWANSGNKGDPGGEVDEAPK
jgi:hypothetical protein